MISLGTVDPSRTTEGFYDDMVRGGDPDDRETYYAAAVAPYDYMLQAPLDRGVW